MTTSPTAPRATISPRALSAPESGIVELVNYARGRDGLIPLWVGEGDLPTPDFITTAAATALQAGETFYTWQRGIPGLREALSRYYARRFGHTLSPEHFYVTGSGMQAIKLAIEAISSAGDDLVLLTPAWPNFAAACDLSGVRPVSVPLTLRTAPGVWTSTGWRLRSRRRRAASSSTRPPTRPAGPRPATISPPSSTSPGAAACGSSPTKSTRSTLMAAPARPPSST